MAISLLNGNDTSIYLNTGTSGSPTWKLVTCAEQSNFQFTTDVVDTTTKCNDGVQSSRPGKSSWTMSFTGKINTSPDTGEVSADDVISLASAKTVKEWAFKNAGATRGYSGEAVITSYQEDANANEDMTFQISLTGNGELTIL